MDGCGSQIGLANWKLMHANGIHQITDFFGAPPRCRSLSLVPYRAPRDISW